MVIGRNNSDIYQIVPKPKDSDKEIESIYSMNRTKDDTFIKCLHYPKLRIKYLTVHRSKGLEASNIIIINLTNDIKGFPNQIASDPILNFVQTEPDEFAFSEERRLFYVALTRTQRKTYLIAPEQRQSVFVKELLEAYEIEAIMSGDEEHNLSNSPKCPKCLKGDLLLRTNEQTNSKFIGCSNYPFCDKTFSNVEILDDQIKCNVCEGYMVKRSGTYGEFYGCTNYPDCHNKLRVEAKYEVPNDEKDSIT
jgi:DNA helicase-4